jgi:hypothetical protein
MLVQLIVALVALALVATFLSRLEDTSFSTFGVRLRYVLLVSRLREAGEVLLKDSADELQAQMTTFVEKAREIAAKAESENRDFTPEERAAVTKALEDARRPSRTGSLEKNGDAALLEQINELGKPVGDLAKGGGFSPAKGKSMGERFAEAEEIKGWLKSVAPSGRIPETAKGLNSPPVAFAGLKDLLTGVSDTSAGALVRNDWLGLVDTGTFMRPLVVRDLVTGGTTGSDAVEYARVTGFTNAAAPVAEATGEGRSATGPAAPSRRPPAASSRSRP